MHGTTFLKLVSIIELEAEGFRLCGDGVKSVVQGVRGGDVRFFLAFAGYGSLEEKRVVVGRAVVVVVES